MTGTFSNATSPRPGAAADDIRQAMAALRAGRAPEAERAARAILANSGGDPEAFLILGISLLRQDRPKDAVEPLEAAARLRPDAGTAVNLALALRAIGRNEDAQMWFERATAAQPVLVPAFAEHAKLFLSMRRFSEAESVLQRGIAAAPNAPDLHVLLGDCFLARGDRTRALAAYQRALALAPQHAAALHGLGTTLLDGGDFAQAAQCFQRLVASGQASVQSGLNFAFCLLELNRWDDAVATLRSIVAADPASHSKALKMLVTSGRGRFWLKPSAAVEFLRPRRS